MQEITRDKLVDLTAQYLKEKLQANIEAGISAEAFEQACVAIRLNSLSPHPFIGSTRETFPSDVFNNLKKRANNSKIHYDVLNQFAIQWMKTRLPAPDPIKNWISQVLSGEIKRPKSQGKTKDSPLRFRLAMATWILKSEYGIQPHKNNASAHDMYGFSIVADAAQTLGLKQVTPHTVRHAYDKDFGYLKPKTR